MRFFLFLLLFSSTHSSFAKNWENIRFTVEGAYPPFSWTTKEGNLKGFEIDLINAICKVMNTKCNITKTDWDGIIPSLLSRKSDAILAAMTITKEREKSVSFTNPYAKSTTRFIMPQEKEINLEDEHFKTLKIGVQRATIGDKYLSQLYPSINIRRYSTFDEAFIDLLNGRLDTVFGGAIGLSIGFLETEQGKNYHFTGPKFIEEEWFGKGIGIAIRKQDRDLKEKLNRALEQIITNGEHKRIAKKYFSHEVM